MTVIAYPNHTRVREQHRNVSAGPGRPTAKEKRHVPDNIIRAAETFLERNTPQKITVKEVAFLAGTTPAMVNYYFKNIEGLLSEIIRIRLLEISKEYETLWKEIRANNVADPLRALIVLVATSFNRRPGLSRLLASEVFCDNSLVRDRYLSLWRYKAKLLIGLCYYFRSCLTTTPQQGQRGSLLAIARATAWRSVRMEFGT